MARVSYGQCAICGSWDFTDRHRCPPTWQCRIDGCHDDDEWSHYYARTAEGAALKMAEDYDSEDYSLVRHYGSEAIVIVRDSDGDNEKRFRCFGEAIPTYYATEIRDTKGEES